MCKRRERCKTAEERLLASRPFNARPPSAAGSAAGVLIELLVADVFGLHLAEDERGAFDAVRDGRRVEIKSASGARIHGVRRAAFDEIIYASLEWHADGPVVTRIVWVPNPPRGLGVAPRCARFDAQPNRLRKPIRLLPPPQRLAGGLPCYRSLRPLSLGLGKKKGQAAKLAPLEALAAAAD